MNNGHYFCEGKCNDVIMTKVPCFPKCPVCHQNSLIFVDHAQDAAEQSAPGPEEAAPERPAAKLASKKFRDEALAQMRQVVADATDWSKISNH